MRRRKASRRRQQPDRHYLFALGLAGLAAWAIWVTVLFTLEPARLLTYLAFFLPLAIGLITTGAIVDYAVEWRMGRFPGLRTPLRRGVLAAGMIEMNLAFLAANRWSVLVLGVSILACTAVEAAALRQSR